MGFGVSECRHPRDGQVAFCPLGVCQIVMNRSIPVVLDDFIPGVPLDRRPNVTIWRCVDLSDKKARPIRKCNAHFVVPMVVTVVGVTVVIVSGG